VSDAVALERLGIPTLTIVQDRFLPAARLHARIQGYPELPLLVEPVFGPGGSRSTVQEFVDGVADDVVRQLTRPVVGPSQRS
jgi:hypothetical protein